MPFRQIPKAITQIFEQVEQTDFPARSKSMASIIHRERPDLIGLQEAVLWSVQSKKIIRTINFLKILLNDLRALGLEYDVIAVNRNYTNRLPNSLGEIIGFLDRDVILARKKWPISIANRQEKNFEVNWTIRRDGEKINLLRGWSYVDIQWYGKIFRCINTHLEVYQSKVQAAQALELLKGPAHTDLPTLLIGDFNSKADGRGTSTYSKLMQAGFIDTWSIAGTGSGFTATQASDLLNPISILNKRIDLILYRGNFKIRKIQVVGDKQISRTPSGLWPSDHAGVIAELD